MKQNVNGIAVVMQKFQTEFARLTEFSRRGNWKSAATRPAFQGAYGEIIKGVNECSTPSCCRSARATASSIRSPMARSMR